MARTALCSLAAVLFIAAGVQGQILVPAPEPAVLPLTPLAPEAALTPADAVPLTPAEEALVPAVAAAPEGAVQAVETPAIAPVAEAAVPATGSIPARPSPRPSLLLSSIFK